MRKVDYQTLARVIAEDRATIQRFQSTPEMRAAVALQLAHSEHIARQFAASASVDARQFLTACGITP